MSGWHAEFFHPGDTWAVMVDRGDHTAVLATVDGEDGPDAQSMALMMAAAPDMLAALEAASAWLDDAEWAADEGPPYDAIAAAIAKATGDDA